MASKLLPFKITARRVVELDGCACGQFDTSRPYGKGSSYPTKADAVWEMKGEFLRHVETCRAATDEAKQEARRALAQHEGRKP